MMFRYLKVYSIFITSIFIFSLLLPTLSYGENNDDIVLVTDFNNYNGNGEIPLNWEVKNIKGNADIKVAKEDNMGYVFNLKSRDKTNTGIGKWIDINIRDFPYLKWKWKVVNIPDGFPVTSLRWWRLQNHDQAAQVYVIFSSEENLEAIPFDDILKNSDKLGYIWASHSAKKDSIVKQPYLATWYVIARSGSNDLSKWCEEEHDVYKDYKRTFGKEPPKVIGVVIMIDTDGTKNGYAESSIGAMYFSKN